MTTPRHTDRAYLTNEQYKDSSRLNARLRLHALYSTNPQGWLPWLFDHISVPATARILEVGCGPAYPWRSNANRLSPGWSVTLTDLSPGMVAEARNNLSDTLPIFSFACADVLSLPFPDSTFDAVLAMHMLYHVPDRPTALHELKRILKPAGHLYASTLGDDNMKELRELLAPFSPRAAQSLTFGAPGSGHAGSFNLEHGGEELQAVFGNVEKYLYEDSLQVTDPEPIADYILSMSTRPDLEERRPGLTKIIEWAIQREGGSIHITKNSGLFIAHKQQ